MIQLQAVRAGPARASRSRPTPTGSSEFEAAFPYQETPDQLTAIAEIKDDMEQPKPMDRLLCGDVGYGKTEVAIRAAFKAVDNGKQVAVLVPTTVLAEQHYRTFSQRMAEYPFVVEVRQPLQAAPRSRRRSLKQLAEGERRRRSSARTGSSAKDVKFKDLGLVVIDEEQRFGVEHKERLKQLRRRSTC